MKSFDEILKVNPLFFFSFIFLIINFNSGKNVLYNINIDTDNLTI